MTGFLQGSAVQVRRQGEGTPPYGTVCRGGRPCPPGPDNATPCRAGPVCPAGCGKNLSGRCGERTERCQWQKQRGERVAAVKISSVRRKAAQKFWAPQQGHRPLRKCNKRCNGRATARVAPTDELQEVQWAGDHEGRPYGGGVMGLRRFFCVSCKFILEKQLGICYTLHYSGNKFLSA